MIIVFGSHNVDLVTEMEQAPQAGQTILGDCFRMEAGGKGANQALAAARAGAEVVMAGAVGSDPLAVIALADLRAAGVDVTRVAEVGEPTGTATIWVERGGVNRIVVAAGANSSARAGQIDDRTLAGATALLMQMEVPVAENAVMIRRAKAAGVRAILNVAPAIPVASEVLAGCALIVVNEDEAGAVAGWNGCGASARELRAALGCDVIRTLGSSGAEAATCEGEWLTPSFTVEAVDTTAAGDCFVGVLAAGLDGGLGLRQAMLEASAAAAFACTRKGAQSSLPTRTEIQEMLQRAR
ncbi:MAG: ribokinase [Hyphomicrobiaceae bacterium]